MSVGIRPEIRHLAVPISLLRPHPRNPNAGDTDAIKESLLHHGQYAAVVYNTHKGAASEGCLVKGNHTYFAALELGWTEMAATTVDVDDDQAIAIMVADNRLSDLHQTDDGLLASLLESLPDVSGTGYSPEDLDELLARVAAASAPVLRGDPDDVPPLPTEEPITKRGDLWLLGRHRLLVGDSTAPADMERLMGGKRAACMWTDPPYGVNYVGKTPDALTLRGDDAEGLEGLLCSVFANVVDALVPGASYYIAHPPGALSATFLQAVLGLGWRVHQTLIWVKDSMVLSHSDYHYQHEPILYGYLPGTGRRGRGGDGWYGDNSQVSVFEVPRPKASPDHPTGKPVGLIEPHLRNSCPPGGIVLDPFAGSGSTLAAAEVTGHTAYLLDVDPRYAQVCIQRFEALTGMKAERHEGVGAGS